MSNTRQAIAYALIAIGALWLLIEVGFVPQSLTLALLDWWPLLLLGLGLDVLLPAARRGPLPVTVYAALVILLIGAFGLSGSQLGSTETFQRPLQGNERSLTATLEAGAAPLTVGAAAPGRLIDATFRGAQPGAATLSGAEEPTFTLRQGRQRLIDLGRSSWSLDLARGLPLHLAARTGSGKGTFDLTELALTEFDLDSRSGAVDVRLPGGGSLYRAELDGGSGRLTVSVAAGASLDLVARAGSGGLDLTIGEGADLQLALSGASGGTVVNLPAGAPIRVEVRDSGSGRLDLPSYLTRKSGSGSLGVWQSAAYERGGRVIDITVERAGSGRIAFR